MSPPALVAWCPAKINLSLRVLGRRDDGYHELDTWFQAIDLWDRLEARRHERLDLSCDDDRVPAGPDNLVLRAARAVREHAPDPKPGASFRLFKKIPVQGGLGGGSSDAAGAILLCARLWGITLPDARAQEIAASLGADVPFFLSGGTARGTGRGDRIEPAPYLGDVRILLGVPPFGIPTTEVFAALAKRLTLPRTGVSVTRSSGPKCQGDNDFSFMANDLEDVVFPARVELRAFRDALLEVGARGALLSGSGSTVYGLFPETVDLAPVVERLRGAYSKWTIVATRAVPRGAFVAAPADTGVD